AGLVDRVLSPEMLRERGYFRPEYVAWLREQQASGRQDFSQHIWALLVFELWHRTFIDTDLSDRKDLGFEDLGLRDGAGLGAARPGRAPEPAQRSDPRDAAPALSIHANTPCRTAGSRPIPGNLDGSTPRRLRILIVADVDPVQPCSGAERVLNEH